MTDLSTKTFVVFDSGLYADLAACMAKSGARVCYFCPWVAAFSDPELADIGVGLPCVERVKYFWDTVREFDPMADDVVFVFPAVQYGDVQEHLKRMGFKVWGSGAAEELELFRADAKKVMAALGLAVNKYEIVKGIPALAKYLQEHENVHVKVSEFRGIVESFHSPNYTEVEGRLDQIAHDLGPYRKRIQQFIVEADIPTKIETGGDDLLVKGRFSTAVACTGLEIKDLGYLITSVKPDELPDPVREFNQAIEPLLIAYDYNGPFHSEIRVGEDGKNYCVDLTCRCGSPPLETMMAWIKNLPLVIWEAAHGRRVEIETVAKYGFQIGIYSEMAPEIDIAVQFPKSLADRVRLYNHAIDEYGVSWVISTEAKLKQLGSVVGLGNTISEAVADGLKNAKQVSADKLDVKTDMVGKLIEELKAAKAKGITLGDSEIPTSIPVD